MPCSAVLPCLQHFLGLSRRYHVLDVNRLRLPSVSSHECVDIALSAHVIAFVFPGSSQHSVRLHHMHHHSGLHPPNRSRSRLLIYHISIQRDFSRWLLPLLLPPYVRGSRDQSLTPTSRRDAIVRPKMPFLFHLQGRCSGPQFPYFLSASPMSNIDPVFASDIHRRIDAARMDTVSSGSQR